MKSNLKSILAYVSLAVLFYSGFCEAIILNNYSMDIFEIKGFSIILLGTIIYAYGLKTEKKLIYIASHIITIIVYIYSIYLILSTANTLNSYVEMDDIGIFFAGLGNGTYIYILSAILFFISIFLPDYNKNTTNKTINNKELTNKLGLEQNNNIQEDNYIFCKYIYGCKELNGYKDGALRINNDNSLSIILLTENNTIQEKKIDYNEIKNINIKNSVVIAENQPKTNDNTFANTVLASAIIGGAAAPLAANFLSNQISEYSKISERIIYEIIIELNNGLIMIQTKINPQRFISKIELNKQSTP